jgi:hypothetical protein
MGFRAFNSAEECHLHTVEAAGSIPATPTKKVTISIRLRRLTVVEIVPCKKAAAAPRTRLLERYDGAIRKILDETPQMLA